MCEISELTVYTTFSRSAEKGEDTNFKCVIRMALNPMDYAPDDCAPKPKRWKFRAAFRRHSGGGFSDEWAVSCIGKTGGKYVDGGDAISYDSDPEGKNSTDDAMLWLVKEEYPSATLMLGIEK